VTMKKNHILIVLIMAFMMMFSPAAYAAIPLDDVLIGSWEYNIAYLTNPTNAAEIQCALDNLGDGPLAYNIEGVTNGWTWVMSGKLLTLEEIAKFPNNITYKYDTTVRY